MLLSDKVALVTGSTSGIGRGIAGHFAALGARVMVHGRDAPAAARVVDEIRSSGGVAEARLADLMDPDACRRLVTSAAEQYGGLDIVVNNAALTTRGSIEDVPLEVVDRLFAVNLRAPLLLIQAAVPLMKARGGGSIVNIGSVNAYIGEPKLCPYSVTKGGLMTLTKNAASSLNRHHIRVNQINVGWTETEGEHRVKREEEGLDETWLADAEKTRPWGRLLRPRDIAYAAAYFASDQSALVTGSVLDLEQHPVGAPPDW
jgi:NAD(P)-dependent dehydrogenase (short-subunit alcohol dehydrogenase family)